MVESSGLSLTHLLHGENKRALRACLGGKANAMRFGREIFGAIGLMEERSSASGDNDGGVCGGTAASFLKFKLNGRERRLEGNQRERRKREGEKGRRTGFGSNRKVVLSLF